jgi:fucose permease
MALAPVFPFIVSFACAAYFDPTDNSTTKIIGGIIVFANLGGLLFPPLVGIVAEQLTIRYALILAAFALIGLFCTALMFWVYASKNRLYDKVSGGMVGNHSGAANNKHVDP